jgi:putative transposase
MREVMPMQDTLGVEPMCRLAGVSRAGFYRYLAQRHPQEEDMEVRSAIHEIVLEHRRRYGYRRVTAELRRRGMPINHKRVARLMRQDNLLAVQPKAFVVTTDSDHELEVYLNLASRMKLTGINQLWVADITYIRLAAEFVYLAVVLDAFSRKAVGWELGARWRRGWRSWPWSGPSASAVRARAWCITPTAACSTPASSTSACCASMGCCPA